MRPGRMQGHQAGMSLVEALVAMIVMAFGTLAVLGVQATLRTNGDIAKQRAEAVRIAQASLEGWRSFTELTGDDAGAQYFQDIAGGESTVEGTNATYVVTSRVPEPSDDPRYRTIVIDVGWTDRSGQAQSVRLSSAIAGAAPAFAGTLAINADTAAVRNPGGRHPTIPQDAVPLEGGRSAFTPPGAPDGVRWVFDNSTGFIVQACTGDVCAPFAGRLLSGFVRFSTTAAPDAEIPGSPRIPGLGVRVVQSAPVDVAGTVQCYEDPLPTGYLPYYCAVPVGTLGAWTGRSEVTGLDLANSIADGDADEFRVCRYTRYRAHRVVPAQMRNEEHPLTYVDVKTALVNQNFLVIRAGNGDDAPFDCPADDTGTPVDGTTWHHQPSS